MRELVNNFTVTVWNKEVQKWEEIETLAVTALIALLSVLGIFLSFAVLTGADIFQWDPVVTLISYFIFSGVIWAVLIIKNR